MTTRKAAPVRKPRADAEQNRALLLETAKAAFAEKGAAAPLEEIARTAGVGIGTLYRHFPTREALFEAVYRREVDQLFALAEKLSRSADPVDGLRKWLNANIRLVATKKGMVEALQLVAHGSLELKTYSFERLTTAIALLLDRGVAAGVFRSDVSPEELLRALVGIFYSQAAEKWQPGALRLVNVFVDGLCNPARPGVSRRRKKSRVLAR